VVHIVKSKKLCVLIDLWKISFGVNMVVVLSVFCHLKMIYSYIHLVCLLVLKILMLKIMQYDSGGR